MVRWTSRQLRDLADTLRELANYAAAALVFWPVRRATASVVARYRGWSHDMVRDGVDRSWSHRRRMVNGFGILIGITLGVAIIGLLDRLGRRRDRRSGRTA